MPSNHMEHFKCSLYLEQAKLLRQVIEPHSIPPTQFVRECVSYILVTPQALNTVLSNCKSRSYRKVVR